MTMRYLLATIAILTLAGCINDSSDFPPPGPYTLTIARLYPYGQERETVTVQRGEAVTITANAPDGCLASWMFQPGIDVEYRSRTMATVRPRSDQLTVWVSYVAAPPMPQSVQ
jgi:hypothetical protein